MKCYFYPSKTFLIKNSLTKLKILRFDTNEITYMKELYFIKSVRTH